MQGHPCVDTGAQIASGNASTFNLDTHEEEVIPTMHDEFESVHTSDNTMWLVKMGFEISLGVISILIEFLQVKSNIFAISPYEMPGIDPDVACQGSLCLTAVDEAFPRKRPKPHQLR